MRVVTWKWAWLSPSETFVRNQVEAFDERVSVVALGAVRIPSPLASDRDRILFGRSWVDRFGIAALRYFGISPQLRRELRELRPDVIHAHFANDAFAIRRTAKRQRIPLVVTLHGRDVTADARRGAFVGMYYRRRLMILFRDASLLLPVSHHIREVACALGAPVSKLVEHHVGVPDTRPQPNHVADAGVVAVGRLVEKKGFTHLLAALALLPEDLRRTRVRIVGDGPLRAQLEKQAAELRLNVEFLGFRPTREISDLLSERPIVCAPSVRASDGDEEGLPTVLVEAARSGCALVGFDHAGIAEIVRNGVTGLLVPERDVAGMAGALEHLIREPGRRAEFGTAARAHWSEEFDLDRQTERLIRLFTEVSRDRRQERPDGPNNSDEESPLSGDNPF